MRQDEGPLGGQQCVDPPLGAPEAGEVPLGGQSADAASSGSRAAGDTPARSLEYVLRPEDEELFLGEILRRRLSFSSRMVKRVKFSGQLLLNGAAVPVRTRGRAGDLLTAVFPEEESASAPEEIPLDIIYEDDRLIAVNKPAGMVVHPTKGYTEGTLLNALLGYAASKGESFSPHFVNRLDRNTSGVVLAAKDPHAHDLLSRSMAAGDLRKEYTAIVHGIVPESGRIDAPLGRDPRHKARRAVREDGYPSATRFERLESFPAKPLAGVIPLSACDMAMGGFSLVRLVLETGRTHQIRAHMTHIGHPLLGDELYAQLYGFWEDPQYMPRQALHACRLEFTHPGSGERMDLRAELPADMESCLGLLRKGGRIEEQDT